MKLKDIKLFESSQYIPYDGSGSLEQENEKLNSFDGFPKTITGNLFCSGNMFSSFKNCPTSITKSFECNSNSQKVDFKDIPQMTVGGDFKFSCESGLFKECKNLNYILRNVNIGGKFIFEDDNRISAVLNSLSNRKKAGDDLEELLVEGMDKTTDYGYPEDFWGDIE